MSLIVNNLEELKTEIGNIDKQKKEIEAVLSRLNNQMSILKEYWSSNTSDAVFNNYVNFKKDCEEVIGYFNNDIQYLNGVLEGIEGFESTSNRTIEDNLAA